MAVINAETPSIPAGSTILWVGDGSVLDTADGLLATLVADRYGLDSVVHASPDATMADGIPALCQSLPAVSAVAYAIVACSGHEPVSRLQAAITGTSATVGALRAAYPEARIVVGTGMACLPADTDETVREQWSTVRAGISGQARRQDALVVDMQGVLGADPQYASADGTPNEAGLRQLAQALIDALDDDRGQPEDTPVTPPRLYSSGLDDWAHLQQRATRKREAEKREANRPTGTELGGLTGKLDELTQAQGVQQVILDQQQAELERQQDELERQQGELEEHQAKLECQQSVLDQQQAALKGAQDQLATVVGNQGDQVASLQALTKRIDEQQQEISRQAQQLIDMENYRTGALLETLADFEARISALEHK